MAATEAIEVNNNLKNEPRTLDTCQNMLIWYCLYNGIRDQMAASEAIEATEVKKNFENELST